MLFLKILIIMIYCLVINKNVEHFHTFSSEIFLYIFLVFLYKCSA